MSDIPKSERTESRLRAQHQAYQIRARITAELMASFAYSQKKQEAHIRRMVQHVKDPEAREEMAKAIRERRKLKAYKRLLDQGRIDYDTIENAFKSWIGGHFKYMSMQQIAHMSDLYQQLYGRRPTWKTGHSRLRWLMAQSSTGSASTATTTSVPRS